MFDQLGSDYKMEVYIVKDGKNEVLPKADWGHFFNEELYLIDLIGKNHRNIVMWMGPKLGPEEYTNTSKQFDLLTNYENSNSITRSRVRLGHEEESLMSLFAT